MALSIVEGSSQKEVVMTMLSTVQGSSQRELSINDVIVNMFIIIFPCDHVSHVLFLCLYNSV